MGLTINTNVTAMIANRNLHNNSMAVSKSMERLSSGYRINRAADDVAGLNISEIMRTQVRGNEVALRNAMDGVSMLQVAEGNLSSITENLQRMRELTVQAANDTYATTERQAIAREVLERLRDIQRIAETAKFNNVKLLDGSNTEINLQVGANSGAEDFFNVASALGTCTVVALNAAFVSGNIHASGGGVYETGTTARTFLDNIDSALNTLFERRSRIGAYEGRLDSITSNLRISIENLTASESRIRDLDVAAETAKLTKSQVLQQAAASVLAQANQIPALALNLIGR